jgi:hypothetical protein
METPSRFFSKMKQALGHNVRSGALTGLIGGGLLAAWATVVFVLHGGAPFERGHLTYGSTIALYLSGGTVSGAIVGALKPLSRYDIGVPVVGIAAALPALVGLRIAREGISDWSAFDIAFIGFGTLLFGLCGALVYLSSRDARKR